MFSNNLHVMMMLYSIGPIVFLFTVWLLSFLWYQLHKLAKIWLKSTKISQI